MFFLEGATSRAPDELVNMLMCKEMGWTYDQLMATPQEVVEDFFMISATLRQFAAKRAGHPVL